MRTSTNSFTVRSHFEGKDATVRKIYDGLLKSARKFGPVSEEPRRLRFI